MNLRTDFDFKDIFTAVIPVVKISCLCILVQA
jgi:hypothetical protein